MAVFPVTVVVAAVVVLVVVVTAGAMTATELNDEGLGPGDQLVGGGLGDPPAPLRADAANEGLQPAGRGAFPVVP